MEQFIFKIGCRKISLLEEKILDIQPLASKQYTYLAITNQGKVIEINTQQESVIILFTFEGEEIDFNDKISILISPNHEVISVFNTFGRFGLVIDLQLNKILMRFGRDEYHYEQTIFPVSFFLHDKQILLIHGTKWNRLDISNPFTGELLTSRADPVFNMSSDGTGINEHYLDYFHGQLLVSPDYEWVVDNGWEWHPIGSVTTWSLKKWINNEWESEDGESKKFLWLGKEDWNEPICWISKSEVGILGKYDTSLYDEEEVVNWHKGFVFRIFNVCGGSILKEFNIDYGDLFFDEYLYCSSQDCGFKVYDVSSGMVIFEDKMIRPGVYHSRSKEFLEIMNDEITIYKLIREKC